MEIRIPALHHLFHVRTTEMTADSAPLVVVASSYKQVREEMAKLGLNLHKMIQIKQVDKNTDIEGIKVDHIWAEKVPGQK